MWTSTEQMTVAERTVDPSTGSAEEIDERSNSRGTRPVLEVGCAAQPLAKRAASEPSGRHTLLRSGFEMVDSVA